ncbi:hypothetical protein [Pontibacter fetidus]|uniref:YARHG domain-containing protein n=1 Tax=Pontibacter fetidus TaxID=2700082 RepID=A0A6B2H805_9BACT|nr:hypothetical protein [Pontibacter fetidus]NDK55294.1 hypothetical protein [Pontibacter fetidus]
MHRSGFYILTVLLAFNLALPGLVTASETIVATNSSHTQKQNNPLFTDESVLEFKLSMDYQELLQDRDEDRQYHPAILSYTDASGLVTVMNLKAMVRGNRRRDASVCAFPPLMLNFVRKTSQHTIFNKVNKVKLVTHCINDDYVIREFLVYKLYNVLTNYSFRVRLCRVTYQDLNGKRKTEQKYAFIIEDDDEMAKRNKGKIVPNKLILNMKETSEEEMARVAFFQYMIGNTDWSVPYRHNIDLVSLDSTMAPIPVPFDFDYAGIVSTPYALPPPELQIASVKQRLFRGYSYQANTIRKTINTFNALRTALYGVYTQCDLLDDNYRKRTLKYLDSFYDTLNSPKDFEKKIAKVARKNEENYVTVKGLK